MVSDEKIRESFQKIKWEINFLAGEVLALKVSLDQIKDMINKLGNADKSNNSQSSTSPAHLQHISDFPAHNLYYNRDLSDNSQFSIGNRGVPADRQQTDNRRSSGEFVQEEPLKTVQVYSPGPAENFAKKEEDKTKKTEEISTFLNTLKQDLRSKFKNLTKQEFIIFSLIYTINEEKGKVTYKDLAEKSSLTESSIRDYIARLEHKGIPIIKERVNNKLVLLRIPSELKDLATLESLSKLKRL
ncbi:MAG: HTH domain-containing protein [Candidatus Pacearchaeota archaeon]|nr:HTH domain-containing protein [Candidatus Pacearchaeota archaeon]